MTYLLKACQEILPRFNKDINLPREIKAKLTDLRFGIE